MIEYFSLGPNRQLNQIVVAGSHDAGVSGGKSNVQTQHLDIGKQALAGVRVFDLRIAATTTSHGGVKGAKLAAYHGKGKTETKMRKVGEVGRNVDRLKLKVGSFGFGLERMLGEARDFVAAPERNEFLILKFDKCSNWGLIAEACVSVLGDSIYKDTGNLNTKTLQELGRSVIVVFTSAGLKAVQRQFPSGSGIHGIQNLFSKDGDGAAYDPDYDGIQYFGKGGTSINPIKMKWSRAGKIAENRKKQAKLMKQGGDGNPDVLGMMYWTSTGLLGSIRSRNEKMWNQTNVAALNKMWEGGLKESISSRVWGNVDGGSYASGGMLKTFMPNIVMIDFADEHKIRHIRDLNDVATTELTVAAKLMGF